MVVYYVVVYFYLRPTITPVKNDKTSLQGLRFTQGFNVCLESSVFSY